jgi:hypothetical protein
MGSVSVFQSGLGKLTMKAPFSPVVLIAIEESASPASLFACLPPGRDPTFLAPCQLERGPVVRLACSLCPKLSTGPGTPGLIFLEPKLSSSGLTATRVTIYLSQDCISEPCQRHR